MSKYDLKNFEDAYSVYLSYLLSARMMLQNKQYYEQHKIGYSKRWVSWANTLRNLIKF